MEQQKAVIYCRVSDPTQLTRGSGLASQETRCRDYAKYRGYEVVEVFHEKGLTGALLNRIQMQNMLRYLSKQKQEHVVIIDDISRLARDVESHIKLRMAIKNARGKLESPSIEFGEDSDSILVENMLASVSQHQRQKNAEQTKNRMMARTKNGYWCFDAPVGYRYDRVSGHSGKVLVLDEPVASVVREALEGFASGRLSTQSEVKRFLEASPHYPRGRDGLVHFQRVTNLLRRSVYAGFIDAPKWGISLQKGKHEALISFETYRKIQERLDGKQPKVVVRKDSREDFPLRGVVTCGSCDHPMTSCWSKGKSRKYPYYMCFKKGCPDYRKSIPREKLEGEFAELIKSARPTEALFKAVLTLFRKVWDDRASMQFKDKKAIESQITAVSGKIDNLLERIVDAENGTVIKAYEAKIQKLEHEKIELGEKLERFDQAQPDFDKTFRTSFEYLGNPYKLWASRKLSDRRTALKLLFKGNVPYHRNMGFRTPDFTLPFKVLGAICDPDYDMARPRGFEPLTS
tara:strand:+ start:472 stop:2019 length:1548 start_codon:yes stop_codon:yes gene_type:complete